MIAKILGKSRDFFYKTKKRNQNNIDITKTVLKLVKEARKVLDKEGGLKLFQRLKSKFNELGIKVGRDKFLKILRDNGLLQIKKKYKKPKTDSNHPFRMHKNLLKDTTVTHIDQFWVSDITYIRVANEWNYLTLIMDLFSRRIMGYSFSKGMSIKETTEAALKMAIKNKRTTGETILHSDRGFQYCNPFFVERNFANNIRPSMSAKGNPYENAAAERLNGILKYEFDLKDEFNNYKVAKKEIDKAILLYNEYRLHFSIELKTPQKVYNNPQVLKNKNIPTI